MKCLSVSKPHAHLRASDVQKAGVFVHEPQIAGPTFGSGFPFPVFIFQSMLATDRFNRDSTGSPPTSRLATIVRAPLKGIHSRQLPLDMASNYPPPPGTTINGNGTVKAEENSALPRASMVQVQLHPQPPPPAAPTQHYADNLSSSAMQAAVNTAHHSLQVLEAATAGQAAVLPAAGEPGLVALQHSSPQPSPQLDGALPTRSPPRSSTSASSQRQTRLRRACDMCSARKVKVS